jgi:hypothetical protein
MRYEDKVLTVIVRPVLHERCNAADRFVLQNLYNTMEQTTRAFLLSRLEALATRWECATR